MVNITTALGVVGGVVGILTGVFSLVYLRRQTQLMADQVGKELEIKITRDLDAPDSLDDSKLRAVLNRRLGDVRSQLRQEFNPRIEEIMRMLQDAHIPERKDVLEDAIRLLSVHNDALEGYAESNSKVLVLERQVQALQQATEDIRNGVGNQAMVRVQIRGIAEQLLRMTGQE